MLTIPRSSVIQTWFSVDIVMESPIEQKHISVINKYPAFRDSFVNGSWKWIEGKRKDDNANGLWRVHDKLYNLEDFVEKHPGGKYWLEVTKVRSRKVC